MSSADFLELGARTATFVFEVDGIAIGQFLEVSGLELTVEVESIKEGGENNFEHKLPGRITWPNLKFKRGVTRSDSLFDWVKKSSGDGFAGAGNKLVRKTAAVTLVSPTGSRLRTWELDGAFPVRWSGPSFAAGSDDEATEELEIAHHGFGARTL